MPDGLIQELLQRMLGGEESSTLPLALQTAMQTIKKEQPDFDPSKVTGLGPMGKALRWGSARKGETLHGAYNPLTGRVEMNPEASGNPDELADTLLHEYTHVRQAARPASERFAQGSIYGQRPDEIEAFQAEADRRARMGREATATEPAFLQAPATGPLAAIMRALGRQEGPTGSGRRSELADIFLPKER